MTTTLTVLVGSVVGLLCACASRPLILALPAGIPERATQPTRIVERATLPVLATTGAVLGGLVALRLGWKPGLAPGLWLSGLLVPIVIIDIQHRVVPDLLTLPGAAVGFALSASIAPGRAEELAGYALAASLVVAVVAFVAPQGMGMGDAKLILLLGAILGSGVLVAVIVSCALLVVPIFLALAAGGRSGLQRTVPLAPFLAVGAALTLVLGG